MPSIILKKYSEPESLNRDDLNRPDALTPLSYADWVKRNFGLASDDAERQYQQYLLGWYGDKKENLNSKSVKTDYINLLKRISFVFRDDAEFRKFTTIDFDDDLQLKLAVPQYVKKLKEIALYYRDKRESVRKSKLKYNMIGSLNSIERTFYEYILKAFSKREYVLNVPEQSAWNAFPDLSSINTGFSIEVEELYDDTDYFDPRESDTYSYDLSSSNPLLFVLSDILEDLWNADTVEGIPLSGLKNPIVSENCIRDYTISLDSLKAANEKYIGTDKFWLTGGYYEEDFYDVELNFNEGNNFFYWFSGEYIREAPHTNFQSLSVNELDWVGNGATAGKEYSASDVIFVDNNGTIEGAWLASFSNIVVEDEMVANIRDNKIFKYPYPSIGVSAEGLEWSGKKVQETIKFEKTFFPNQTIQNQVKNNLRELYWTNSDSVSTVRPLPINATSLVDDGAFASKRFPLADKIITRLDTSDKVHDFTPDELFSNDLDIAWLYDFSKTQLPIGKTLNKIYWPIHTYEDPEEINITYTHGDTLNINDIDSGAYVGAIAGTDIDTSDIIYKKTSWCAEPTEAAWLMGTPLSSFNNCKTTSAVGDFVEGAIQAGVMFKSDPDKYTRFIWTGEGEQSFKQSLNHSNYRGFQGFKHDASCPYLQISTENRISLLDNSKINTQWDACECGAIHYSPMGHTGSTFRSIGVELGDFIIMDTSFPDFKALQNWIGSDGKSWETSEDFAWFKLDSGQIDGSVGWGEGTWVTNTGEDFKIKPGKTYKYFRSGLQLNCELTTEEEGGPFFIGKHQNCGCTYLDCECNIQNCQPVWMRAELINGVWVDTGEPSEMTLESGYYYDYDHKPKQPFSIVNSDGGVDDECLDSTNFIFGVDIPNAKPYWAKGTYEKEKNSKFKGLMYSGENEEVKLGYLHPNQPLPSDLIMVDDMYIRYERNAECSNSCFIWNQPLTWDIDFEKTTWNTLKIDECVQSEIQHFIINSDCKTCEQLNERCPSCCNAVDACGCVLDDCLTTKTGLTATNEESTMLLRTSYDLKPVFTNYFAINPYTMNVRVVDTTLGLPPSGGRWVPENKEIFAQARTPWNNLASLYSPFVADRLSTNLYNKSDVGFFTPDKLGYTTLLLKDKKIEIGDTSIRSASTVNIVIDTDHYAKGPYTVTYTDSTWMKWRGQCIGGEIKGASMYQEFVPYQTSFETLLRNDYGIQQQSDLQSPWTGKFKDEFKDDKYPKNIKGERAVYCGPNSWYNNQPDISGTMYQWKSDVYGNQYGLYKTSACNIWDRDSSGGDLWVRDLLGNVALASQLLSSVIDTYKNTSTVITPITAGEILHFDVLYDTLIMQLPAHVVFERLNMDFDDGNIYSIADQSCIFNVTSSEYAGSWLNESNKVVTFGWFKDGLPTIQQLALDKSKFNTLFDSDSDTSMWDGNFDSTDKPQLTYNSERNIYNMTFMATSGAQDVLVVSNFEFEDIYSLESTSVKIIPLDTVSNKKLIKTVAYDDKLLLVFEQQTCPNQVFQVVIDN